MMITKNFVRYYLVVGVILTLFFSCSKKPPADELTKVKVGMMFVPNVQFAPFYVALEEGYYKAADLDVSFDYSSQMDAIQLVGIGKFDFVVGDGEQVIIARDRGLPIKYVMSIYSRYPLAIAALASSGITEPAHLSHKTIGIPDFYGASYIGLKALLKAVNLSENQMDIVSIGFTQAASLNENRVDAAVVYLNNTPVQMRNGGKKLNIIPIHNYVSLVSAGIITNESMMEQYPHIVKSFVQATLKGMEFVRIHPEQALEICFKFIKEGRNTRNIQLQILKESIKLYENKYGPGFSDPQTWENTQNILFELKLIKQKQDINFFYTNSFLN